MALTTATSNFADLVQDMVEKRLEEALRSALVFATPGSFDDFRHEPGTNTFVKAAYGDIAYVADTSTALVEGVAPAGVGLTISIDSFSATQRGKLIQITDLAQFESPHQLASVAAEKAARWAAECIDTTALIAMNAMTASTNIIYGGTSAAVSRSTVDSKMTGLLLKQAVGRLRMTNVAPFTDGYYRAIMSPRAIIDLSTDSAVGGFLDSTKYVDNEPLLAGEVGTFAGARILSSTVVGSYATATSGKDVIRSYVYGPGFLGMGDVSTVEVIVTPPGGHGDPLKQILDVGVKAWIGASVLSAAGYKGVIVETQASVLTSGQA